ncbi:MAG TPA: sugar ABC transporter substrate-binding protein [Lichenihabitans sp.]|jgi:ABC-type sugar transport system substrate-binding protein|nr:sugar ABC transporter substrate-binding protein [Lichenihabitans sp.]
MKVLGTCAAALLMGLSAASAATAADRKLSIGIVTFSTSDLNTNDMVASMTADAQAKGWTVTNLNAQGEPLQANTAMKQLVIRKADAIIVTVFDSTSLASGIAAAREAGIPVLSAGGGLAPGVAFAASTGAAPPIVDLMLKDLNDSGSALDLSYHPGIPCRERADAFDAAVKANPGIKASSHEIDIQSAAASSQAATSAWLAGNSASSGPFAIFNCFDDNAMGAIAALKQNGRTDVKVYSFNATAPALQAIKNGTMTATLWVDLKSAGTILVDAIPEILKAGASWQPKSVVPGNVVVTKANVDDFIKQHPDRG